MKKTHLLILVLFLTTSSIFSQEKEVVEQSKFYADFAIGPYLMVDHHLYKSVVLKGTRLGYHINSKFSIGLEYLVGQQHDDTGELGTTHTANGQIFYYFKDRSASRKFSPYIVAGGGFVEFKDFSEDIYGVAFYGGAGLSYPIFNNIKGFFESKYVSLAPLNLGGKNELGLLWGVRVDL